jgi:diadenosine tetraphosphate (Ap4A) HIT family hydrolase
MTEYESEDKNGNCIFCKIVKKEMETPGIFYENEKYLAFLSIFPNTIGNAVVIPKKHNISDVLKLEDDILQEFILEAKKVSQILEKRFENVGRIGLIMEGTGINHAHIKLYPMHDTKFLKGNDWTQCPSGINKFFDKYEGYLSSNDGPMAKEEDIKKLAKELKNIQLK